MKLHVNIKVASEFKIPIGKNWKNIIKKIFWKRAHIGKTREFYKKNFLAMALGVPP